MWDNISKVFFRVEEIQHGCYYTDEVLKVDELLTIQLDIAFSIPVLVYYGNSHLRIGVKRRVGSWSGKIGEERDETDSVDMSRCFIEISACIHFPYLLHPKAECLWLSICLHCCA